MFQFLRTYFKLKFPRLCHFRLATMFKFNVYLFVLFSGCGDEAARLAEHVFTAAAGQGQRALHVHGADTHPAPAPRPPVIAHPECHRGQFGVKSNCMCSTHLLTRQTVTIRVRRFHSRRMKRIFPKLNAVLCLISGWAFKNRHVGFISN